MANKLRNIFSSDMPEFIGTVKFPDAAKKNEFENIIKGVIERGESAKFDDGTVSGMTLYMKTKSGKRLLDEHDNISYLVVGPSQEPAPITVVTDYGNYTFMFNRIRLKDKVILENKKDDIVHIVFELSSNIEFPQFNARITYDFHLDKAKSILNIVETCNAVKKFLIKYLNSEKNTNDDVRNTLLFLEHTELMFLRLYEIEKLYNATFQPSKIKSQIQSTYNNLNLLYLLLVKRLPIKQNLDDFSFTLNKASATPEFDNLKKGGKGAISFVSQETFNVYGKVFKVSVANFIFNSIIDNITENEAGDYTIVCTGTDYEPMFRVLRGYIKKTDSLKNVDYYNKGHLNELLSAKSFEETLADEIDEPVT